MDTACLIQQYLEWANNIIPADSWGLQILSESTEQVQCEVPSLFSQPGCVCMVDNETWGSKSKIRYYKSIPEMLEDISGSAYYSVTLFAGTEKIIGSVFWIRDLKHGSFNTQECMRAWQFSRILSDNLKKILIQ